MKTIQAIKHLSIRAYLAEQGLHPTKDNPRYGLYLSPLREEHMPSFKVDYERNLWYDFGLGEGGSIIDLVMRLKRCDFAHAVRLLRTERGYRSLHPDLCRLYRPFPRSVSSPTHRFVIRHCSTIYDGAVSFRRLPALIVGKYAIRSMAENISPSDFRTMPADGSCARNASKEVHRPNRLRRSTTAPIR